MTRKVLTNGYIALKGVLGNDAEVSDTYWTRHEDHLSQTFVQFEIKCPLFLIKSFQKFNESEISWYKELEEFYVPAYFVGNFSEQDQNDLNSKIQNFNNWSFNFYKKLLSRGVSKEQAKMIIPQNIFVKFTWTVNVKTLFIFLRTHMKAHSLSPEMQQYIRIIFELFKEQYPLLADIFEGSL